MGVLEGWARKRYAKALPGDSVEAIATASLAFQFEGEGITRKFQTVLVVGRRSLALRLVGVPRSFVNTILIPAFDIYELQGVPDEHGVFLTTRVRTYAVKDIDPFDEVAAALSALASGQQGTEQG